ncbi:MAG: response regulator transcription factor [Caldilineaceae bacterium]|nr:response regulator transcription factor [Caldilineaceae bacterium]MCB9159258.1 response regulator transcription factor [Caldilineaceae bacterium]
MSSITVLLAEDHTIVRKGIRSLLDAERDIDVVGEAENGREAVEIAEVIHPDIVVMDHSMPVLNGLEAMRQIRQRDDGIKVLILTMHTNEEYVFQFLRAGAAGYVVKQSAPNELVAAIRAVAAGQSYLSPSISKTVIDEYVRQSQELAITDSYDALTAREREVLQLIAEGNTNREIATQLHISVKTAGVHRNNIMQKLHLTTMAELTRYAIRKGIISLEQ